MRLVFFGSSEFAIRPLEAILQSGHRMVLVVTQPDRAKGRGLKVSPTPLKEFASDKPLEIYQPSVLNEESARLLRKKEADLFVVVSYGKIIPKAILDIPRIFSINLHASLLPKYRGAAPINWALINGEKKTGISIIRMNERMDAGDIIFKEETTIAPDEDAAALAERLSLLGSKGLVKTIDSIEKGDFKLIKQNEKEATFAPKLSKLSGIIDWSRSSLDIHNLVRGLIPWPCAFTYYGNKVLKIWKTALSESNFKNARPAEVVEVTKEGITVKAGAGALIIKELQPAGSRIMSCREFIAGHKIKVKDTFQSKIYCNKNN